MLPTNLRFIWPSGFRGEDFLKKSTNQKQELTVAAMFVSESDDMSNLHRWPSIDASYQISVHLAKRFQRRRFFLNRPIRNKNCLRRPCLLKDRNKMSNRYRGPAIDASYQVSFGLGGAEEIKMWKVNGRQMMAKTWIKRSKKPKQTSITQTHIWPVAAVCER